jgi:hypothetical protein
VVVEEVVRVVQLAAAATTITTKQSQRRCQATRVAQARELQAMVALAVAARVTATKVVKMVGVGLEHGHEDGEVEKAKVATSTPTIGQIMKKNCQKK